MKKRNLKRKGNKSQKGKITGRKGMERDTGSKTTSRTEGMVLSKCEYFDDQYQVKLNEYKIEMSAGLKLGASGRPYLPDNVWVTGAPLLWAAKIQGTGCKVGVIDTGVDNTHPDLAGKVLLRRDYVRDGVSPSKFDSHGTHVAGTICANGQIKGVAPLASIIDYRVLGVDGSGSFAAVTQAILDAIADGCAIINMSLGGPYNYIPLHNAIKRAVQNNVLVVVPSGNEGPGQISYPAYYPEVVSVGAVNFDRSSGKINLPETPWFSNSNREVDVAADGWRVLSTVPGGYAYLTGTSMATPCVSGVACLLWDRFRKRMGRTPTGQELMTALKTSTIDILQEGIDLVSGAGFLTFYPELPKMSSSGQWSLPSMNGTYTLI
jgi:major intracellular serine protease